MLDQVLSSFLLAFALDSTFLMPESTPEIKNLIIKLGDNNYFVREKSEYELKRLGWDALKTCYLESYNNDDPEIKRRAGEIYISYFNLNLNEIPNIWFLPDKIRFPQGYKIIKNTFGDKMGSTCLVLKEKDLAKYYYEIAFKKIYPNEKITDWRLEIVRKKAIILYLNNCLIQGEKKENLKKIINKMLESKDKYKFYYQTENIYFPTYDWVWRAPGPMIKNNLFIEPTPVFFP